MVVGWLVGLAVGRLISCAFEALRPSAQHFRSLRQSGLERAWFRATGNTIQRASINRNTCVGVLQHGA